MEREERKSEKAYTAAASNKKKGDYTTQGGRKKSEVDGSVVCHNDQRLQWTGRPLLFTPYTIEANRNGKLRE